MTTIDHKTACAIRDLIKGAYFGNPHQYGDLMGYHCGHASMICLHVPARANPEWEGMGYNGVRAHMNELIAPLGLPIESAPDPDFFDREWQVYFTII